MSIDILMPALSPTMTDGKLAKWHKQEGDAVKSGDILCEIETDKATMEVESVDDGTLGKIVVPAGSEGVPVNSVIAVLLEEGEDASALARPASPPPHGLMPSIAPIAVAAPAASSAPRTRGDRVAASPLARRIARDKGVDLALVTGSGPNGRIVKEDVEAAASRAPSALVSVPPRPFAAPTIVAAPTVIAGERPYREIPNTSMRKIIAKRLTEASQTIPHFTLTVDCELDALMRLREEANARRADKISLNDFIVKAVALALRKVPEANASWTEAAILQYENVDVSVAVATESGLITPIVRDADRKGLAEIAAEIKELSARARQNKLMPEEFQGGGFTISNLGMFGIKQFSAIINPPQSCILAVGMGEKRPVVRDNALGIATLMTCTLSVDHRSVDGATGARWLAEFKKFIEDPLSMLL